MGRSTYVIIIYSSSVYPDAAKYLIQINNMQAEIR